jgi:hypothetical protein
MIKYTFESEEGLILFTEILYIRYTWMSRDECDEFRKSNGREPIEHTHSASSQAPSSKVPIMHVAPNCQHVTCA